MGRKVSVKLPNAYADASVSIVYGLVGCGRPKIEKDTSSIDFHALELCRASVVESSKWNSLSFGRY